MKINIADGIVTLEMSMNAFVGIFRTIGSSASEDRKQGEILLTISEDMAVSDAYEDAFREVSAIEEDRS